MPIIKRTPAGTIYTQDTADTLYLRFRGQRISTHLKNTRAAVAMAEQQLENLWREEVGLDSARKNNRVRVNVAWAEFLKVHGANKAKGTLELYRLSYKTIVADGTYFLTESEIQQDALKFLKNHPVRMSTKEIYLRPLSTFINWCVRHEYMRRNPIKEIRPKVPPPAIEIYTEEEVARIVKHFEEQRPEFALLLRFLHKTGFRIHEALELKWVDVQPDRLSLVSKDKKHREYYPRNAVVDEILAKLLHDREKVFRWKIDTSSRLNRWLVAGMKELKIPQRGRSFHEFRKTRWSYLIAQNVNPVVASKAMRCSIRTAMKHYIDAQDDAVRAASEL